eukprot:864848-Prymnesium_polylepis.1
MFTDGVFNADPHAGNLLVRLEEGVGPMPVLLDFGLCKRLSPQSTLGFCRLVHALTEQDGDGLIGALVSLGLKLNVEAEPFEFLASLMFAFRDSEADAGAARQKHKANIANEQKRDKVYKKHAKQLKKAGEKPPLEAIPPEVVYFFRTVDMLQGLCTRLE